MTSKLPISVPRMLRMYFMQQLYMLTDAAPEDALYDSQATSEFSRIAQAIDYSRNHRQSLTRHLEDGAVPIDNNLIERQIKPWMLGA